MPIKGFMSMLGLGEAKNASGPQGCRAYVIGDVHGRLDLLTELMGRIERDIAAAPGLRHVVVFLGDLIDRGPNSKGVIDFLSWHKPQDYKVIYLMGNHEETFLSVLNGDRGALTQWFRFGGRECVKSYGVTDLLRIEHAPRELLNDIIAAVPRRHREFIESFDDSFRFGDYVCVHAGIRPGLALEEQDPHDLRWIREEFMESSADHGFVTVHGHTVVAEPEEASNRISIDTGAWQTGRLTALVIEGETRRFIITEGESAAMPGHAKARRRA